MFRLKTWMEAHLGRPRHKSSTSSSQSEKKQRSSGKSESQASSSSSSSTVSVTVFATAGSSSSGSSTTKDNISSILNGPSAQSSSSCSTTIINTNPTTTISGNSNNNPCSISISTPNSTPKSLSFPHHQQHHNFLDKVAASSSSSASASSAALDAHHHNHHHQRHGQQTTMAMVNDLLLEQDENGPQGLIGHHHHQSENEHHGHSQNQSQNQNQIQNQSQNQQPRLTGHQQQNSSQPNQNINSNSNSNSTNILLGSFSNNMNLSSPDTGYSTDGYSPKSVYPALSFESSGKSTPKSCYTISSLVSSERLHHHLSSSNNGNCSSSAASCISSTSRQSCNVVGVITPNTPNSKNSSMSNGLELDDDSPSMSINSIQTHSPSIDIIDSSAVNNSITNSNASPNPNPNNNINPNQVNQSSVTTTYGHRRSFPCEQSDLEILYQPSSRQHHHHHHRRTESMDEQPLRVRHEGMENSVCINNVSDSNGKDNNKLSSSSNGLAKNIRTSLLLTSSSQIPPECNPGLKNAFSLCSPRRQRTRIKTNPWISLTQTNDNNFQINYLHVHPSLNNGGGVGVGANNSNSGCATNLNYNNSGSFNPTNTGDENIPSCNNHNNNSSNSSAIPNTNTNTKNNINININLNHNNNMVVSYAGENNKSSSEKECEEPANKVSVSSTSETREDGVVLERSINENCVGGGIGVGEGGSPGPETSLHLFRVSTSSSSTCASVMSDSGKGSLEPGTNRNSTESSCLLLSDFTSNSTGSARNSIISPENSISSISISSFNNNTNSNNNASGTPNGTAASAVAASKNGSEQEPGQKSAGEEEDRNQTKSRQCRPNSGAGVGSEQLEQSKGKANASPGEITSKMTKAKTTNKQQENPPSICITKSKQLDNSSNSSPVKRFSTPQSESHRQNRESSILSSYKVSVKKGGDRPPGVGVRGMEFGMGLGLGLAMQRRSHLTNSFGHTLVSPVIEKETDILSDWANTDEEEEDVDDDDDDEDEDDGEDTNLEENDTANDQEEDEDEVDNITPTPSSPDVTFNHSSSCSSSKQEFIEVPDHRLRIHPLSSSSSAYQHQQQQLQHNMNLPTTTTHLNQNQHANTNQIPSTTCYPNQPHQNSNGIKTKNPGTSSFMPMYKFDNTNAGSSNLFDQVSSRARKSLTSDLTPSRFSENGIGNGNSNTPKASHTIARGALGFLRKMFKKGHQDRYGSSKKGKENSNSNSNSSFSPFCSSDSRLGGNKGNVIESNTIIPAGLLSPESVVINNYPLANTKPLSPAINSCHPFLTPTPNAFRRRSGGMASAFITSTGEPGFDYDYDYEYKNPEEDQNSSSSHNNNNNNHSHSSSSSSNKNHSGGIAKASKTDIIRLLLPGTPQSTSQQVHQQQYNNHHSQVHVQNQNQAQQQQQSSSSTSSSLQSQSSAIHPQSAAACHANNLTPILAANHSLNPHANSPRVPPRSNITANTNTNTSSTSGSSSAHSMSIVSSSTNNSRKDKQHGHGQQQGLTKQMTPILSSFHPHPHPPPPPPAPPDRSNSHSSYAHGASPFMSPHLNPHSSHSNSNSPMLYGKFKSSNNGGNGVNGHAVNVNVNHNANSMGQPVASNRINSPSFNNYSPIHRLVVTGGNHHLLNRTPSTVNAITSATASPQLSQHPHSTFHPHPQLTPNPHHTHHQHSNSSHPSPLPPSRGGTYSNSNSPLINHRHNHSHSHSHSHNLPFVNCSPSPVLRNPRYQYITSSNQNSPLLNIPKGMGTTTTSSSSAPKGNKQSANIIPIFQPQVERQVLVGQQQTLPPPPPTTIPVPVPVSNGNVNNSNNSNGGSYYYVQQSPRPQQHQEHPHHSQLMGSPRPSQNQNQSSSNNYNHNHNNISSASNFFRASNNLGFTQPPPPPPPPPPISQLPPSKSKSKQQQQQSFHHSTRPPHEHGQGHYYSSPVTARSQPNVMTHVVQMKSGHSLFYPHVIQRSSSSSSPSPSPHERIYEAVDDCEDSEEDHQDQNQVRQSQRQSQSQGPHRQGLREDDIDDVMFESENEMVLRSRSDDGDGEGGDFEYSGGVPASLAFGVEFGAREREAAELFYRRSSSNNNNGDSRSQNVGRSLSVSHGRGHGQSQHSNSNTHGGIGRSLSSSSNSSHMQPQPHSNQNSNINRCKSAKSRSSMRRSKRGDEEEDPENVAVLPHQLPHPASQQGRRPIPPPRSFPMMLGTYLSETETRLLEADKDTDRKYKRLITEAENLLKEISGVEKSAPQQQQQPSAWLSRYARESLQGDCPQSDPLRRKAYDCWALRRLQQELAMAGSGCCASPPVLHRSRLHLQSPVSPSGNHNHSNLSRYEFPAYVDRRNGSVSGSDMGITSSSSHHHSQGKSSNNPLF